MCRLQSLAPACRRRSSRINAAASSLDAAAAGVTLTSDEGKAKDGGDNSAAGSKDSRATAEPFAPPPAATAATAQTAGSGAGGEKLGATGSGDCVETVAGAGAGAWAAKENGIDDAKPEEGTAAGGCDAEVEAEVEAAAAAGANENGTDDEKPTAGAGAEGCDPEAADDGAAGAKEKGMDDAKPAVGGGATTVPACVVAGVALMDPNANGIAVANPLDGAVPAAVEAGAVAGKVLAGNPNPKELPATEGVVDGGAAPAPAAAAEDDAGALDPVAAALVLDDLAA